MPIDFKLSGGWVRTAQPYVKLSANAWTPLKRALVKVSSGWKEVWPSEFVYVHTGYGYNMNMHACFGYPSAAGKYTFINRGYIGGSVNGGATDFALDTGAFPEGSTVTFINEGYVSGSGGDGSSFTSSGPPGNPRYATAGGNALIIRTWITIDNTAGVIQAGGGGGGAVGDFAGSTRHNRGGGGGAGLPGGRARIDSWGGNSAAAGSLTAGGAGNIGGNGGNPGGQGQFPPNRVNNDYDIRTQGAGAGIAIYLTALILSGSSGLGAGNVIGRQLPWFPRVQFSYFGTSKNTIGNGSNYGNWGVVQYVNVLYGGTNASVSVARIGGSSVIAVSKLSNERFQFWNTATGGSAYSPQTFDSGVFRFTVTSAEGTDYFDFVVTCGRNKAKTVEHRSCFPAGSLITMADGTLRPIELIMTGEFVKTAVGISEVVDIDFPQLGKRALYEFEDGKCQTSAEHSVWSRHPESGEQWWATRDMDQWILEAETGAGPNFDVKPYDLTEKEGQVWEFATETGWVSSTWRRVEAPEDLQLYHLLLAEGGSYYVDGYLVSSMADSGGVDWHTYDHNKTV